MVFGINRGRSLYNSSFIHFSQPSPNTRDQLYNLAVVTPAAEPVTWQELADQLRLDGSDDQPYVTALGIAGRMYVEASTKLTLVSTTYDVSYDVLDNNGIRLPRRPVTAVASVKYIDQQGTQQTLSPSLYDIDTKSIWTTIRPKPNIAFPVTTFSPNAVTVRFTAGTATDAASVSPLAKLAITSWVAHQYENREAVTAGKMEALPLALESILWLLSSPGV